MPFRRNARLARASTLAGLCAIIVAASAPTIHRPLSAPPAWAAQALAERMLSNHGIDRPRQSIAAFGRLLPASYVKRSSLALALAGTMAAQQGQSPDLSALFEASQLHVSAVNAADEASRYYLYPTRANRDDAAGSLSALWPRLAEVLRDAGRDPLELQAAQIAAAEQKMEDAQNTLDALLPQDAAPARQAAAPSPRLALHHALKQMLNPNDFETNIALAGGPGNIVAMVIMRFPKADDAFRILRRLNVIPRPRVNRSRLIQLLVIRGGSLLQLEPRYRRYQDATATLNQTGDDWRRAQDEFDQAARQVAKFHLADFPEWAAAETARDQALEALDHWASIRSSDGDVPPALRRRLLELKGSEAALRRRLSQNPDWLAARISWLATGARAHAALSRWRLAGNTWGHARHDLGDDLPLAIKLFPGPGNPRLITPPTFGLPSRTNFDRGWRGIYRSA